MTEYAQFPTAPARTDRAPSSGNDAAMKDKAVDAAEAGKQAVGDVAQTAAEKAKDVAQETSRQARDLLGDARSQLTEQAGNQHRHLVDSLRSLGDELDSMVSNSDQSGPATQLTSQARDRVHGAADWLDGREPGDLVDELRSLARRRPAAFLVGAALAGVVAGRLTRGVVAGHAEDADSSSTADTAPTFEAAPDPGLHRTGDYATAVAPTYDPAGPSTYAPAPPPGYEPVAPPAYGTPAYGAPTYGAPSYGAPSYGAPSYGSGAPSYGPTEGPDTGGQVSP
jgi:hypothetical protein